MSNQIAFGIYGYDFPGAMQVKGVDLQPLHQDGERKKMANDEHAMCLTGFCLVPSDDKLDDEWSGIVKLLTDAMTFSQQRWVMASLPIVAERKEELPSKLPFLFRRQSAGSIIYRSVSSQSLFFETFLDRARQDPDGPLISAFYRQLEISRLSTPFWELQQFLAFTGLEILAREYPNKSYKESEFVFKTFANDLLTSKGFNVDEALLKNFAKGRNGAFHQGKASFEDKDSQQQVQVAHQLYAMKTLLADLILKLLNFDDGKINWNRWKDRMPWA